MEATVKISENKEDAMKTLHAFSYYTLCRIADVTHYGQIGGMAVHLAGGSVSLDEFGNFLSCESPKHTPEFINDPFHKPIKLHLRKAVA